MNNFAVEINGLEKTYKTESESLTILKNLDLRIEEGSKVVIIGESGSGKSTFLNIVGGLDKATCGSVKVGPYEITSLDEKRISEYRSTYLGLIFQFHYLLKDNETEKLNRDKLSGIRKCVFRQEKLFRKDRPLRFHKSPCPVRRQY